MVSAGNVIRVGFLIVCGLPAVATGSAYSLVSKGMPRPVSPAPPMCDVDRDGDVDKADLGLIKAAVRGKRSIPAIVPFDARDANGDGRVSAVDRAICRHVCTKRNCKKISAPANRPPVADAGADQTVFTGVTVTLNGSASADPDGDPLTYAWTLLSRPAGSSATLAGATTVAPTFVADVAGNYTLRLTVSDGRGGTASDEVLVTTIPRNTPPVADAGADQTVDAGQLVTLDGSGSSDVDGDALSFAWQLEVRPNGSTATLSNATAVMPTFTPDVVGLYVVRLTVNDGRGGTATDTVDVTTEPGNREPVANAGPDQAVEIGATVLLDGTGSSDPDGDALGFSWSFVSRPSGSTASILNANLPNASFVADRAGDYVVQLVVNDGEFDSDADTALVSTSNTPPVADAGADQTVDVGEVVRLNGAGSSDANDDPLSFFWSFVSRPVGSTAELAGALTPTPSFTADVAGLFVVQLIVNDGTVDSSPDSANVTAVAVQANRPPVADDDVVTTGVDTPVTVDVLGNDTDPDGDTLAIASFGQGAHGTVSSVAGGLRYAPNAGFAGIDSFTYVASDGQGGSDSATVTVTVAAGLPTVTIQATDANAAEPGTDTGTFTVTRSGATSSELLVTYALGGSAGSGVDYAALGGSVAIPAGQASATITLTPLDDALVEPNETAVLTLSANAAYVIGSPASATVTIADDTPNTVTIVATDASAAEPGTNTGLFTVSRTGPTTFELLVTYSIDGTAGSGIDYAALSGSVTIPAGQASATIALTPLDDALIEPDETARLTVSPSPSTYVVGAAASATVTIADDTPNTVTIVATDASAAEPGTNAGVFTVSRTGPTTFELLVTYSIGGTAGSGTDYAALSGSVTIPAGQASATIALTPLDDALVEPDETAVLTVAPSPTTYVVGAPASATVTIADDDVPGNQAPIADAGPDQSVYVVDTIALDGSASSDPDGDTLTYQWSVFNAPQGAAVAFSSQTVAQPTLTVNLPGAYVFRLIVHDGTTSSEPSDVTVDVMPVPALAIGNVQVSEGDAGTTNAVFNVTISAAIPRTVTATFTTAAGTATADVDFVATTGTVTFPPNSTTPQQVTVVVNGDTAVEPNETFFVDLTGPTNATIVTARGTGTILTDDALALTLTPSAQALLTGATGNLTVTLPDPAGPGGTQVNLSSNDADIASVPPTVLVPEAQTSAPIQVTAGTKTGTAQITATATGLASDTASVTVNARGMSLSLAGPLLAIGRTIAGTVTLSQPAPAGGIIVALASSATSVATVSPTSVAIPAGSTQASFGITGAGLGNATITATSPGYASPTAVVTVTSNLISFGALPVVAPGQTLPFPVSLSSPAPGDVVITFTSANTAIATVTTSVVIPAGLQVPVANPTLTGVAFGTTQITAAATGFAPDSSTAFVSLNMTLTPNPLALVAGTSENVTLNLSAPAPTGGLAVNLATGNASVATAPAQVVVAAGQTSAVIAVSGVAAGSTTLTASFPGINSANATINVTPAPLIELPQSITVGRNLQDGVSATLETAAPPPLGVQVTITSADPARLLLSTSSTTAGTASITLQVAGNATAIPTFYVQALDGSGTVNIIASAPGYANGTRAVALYPSGFIINAPGSITTTTFANPTNVQIASARLAPSTFAWLEAESVRAGLAAPVSVAVTSSNTAVGTIVTSPLSFGTNVGSQTTQFDPAGEGTSTIAVVTPAGFDTPSDYRQITATVTGATITAPVAASSSWLVGEDMQDGVTINLGQVPPAAVDLTVTVASGAVARVSDSATALGGTTVVFPGVSNTTSRTFYLQGLAQGTTTVTIAASGYTTVVRDVAVHPSGFIINSPGVINTTTLSNPTNVQIVSARLAPGTLAWAESEPVRAGLAAPIAVSVSSSNTAVGTIVTSPLSFSGNVGSQTTQFDPLGEGTTTVAAVAPAGFETPSTFRQITATVTGATITAPVANASSWLTGEDLQDSVSVNLGQTPPAPVDITVGVSSGSIVRVSTSPTVLGGTEVVFPAVADTTSRTFYLQGLAIGAATVTISAPGYTTVVRDVTVHPSGFIINSPGVINTTTFSGNTNVQVVSARLTPGTLNWVESEAVRPGLAAPVSVAVTSSNASVGAIVTSPLAFAANVGSQTTQFDPLTEGTSTVSVVTPTGFETPGNLQQITATVTGATIIAPVANASNWLTGEDLQDTVSINLGQVPPSPVDLTVTVASGAIARVSDSNTVLGGTTVVFQAVANTSSRTFYLQGLAQGATTVTISAPGYTTVVRTVTVHPSAFIINSPGAINTTAGGANVNLSITSARLNPATLAWAENEVVRAGLAAPVSVAVTSSNTAVGTITTSPLSFGANVGTQGTQFDPQGAGASSIAVVTPSGFDTSNNFREITATVSP